jgi:8-oxo-dGTP diphosphatase
MDFLKKITDIDISQKIPDFKKREAVRGVFLDDRKLMPLLYVAKHDYYKLPGGGIEKEENKKEALKREMCEETGCKVEILNEVGKIVEFRVKWNLKQTSFCYFGKILKKEKPLFTEEEMKDGFQLLWLTPEKALFKIEKKKINNYHGSFIQKRDACFLKEVIKNNFFENENHYTPRK